MINDENQDITLSEAAVLTEIFSDIAKNIKTELDDRINNYSNSLLYKYYNNLFYFIPKHCLLEIEDSNYSSYRIVPDEQFFIYDKKSERSLTYTPRMETNILPAEKVQSYKVNDNNLAVRIRLKNNFEYDSFNLWINPNLSNYESYSIDGFLEEILNSKTTDIFAKVRYKDGSEAIKKIFLSKLRYQLKPIENIAMEIHSRSICHGFNIKIENLFSYKSDEVKKITLYFKVNVSAYGLHEVENLFKINLVPVFNLFNDYSYSFYANKLLSQTAIKHSQDTSAVPISINSVYENNKVVEFNNFYFEGVNEYYFNVSKHNLDYNVVFPDLANRKNNTKIHVHATWTQDLDLSSLIEVNSSLIASTQCKIKPINILPSKSNFDQSSATIFNLVDKLVSNNIYVKSTFLSILTLLDLSKDKIDHFAEIIQDISVDVTSNHLTIITSNKYSKESKFFLRSILRVVCQFININSFTYIKEFAINEGK
jgi:hypothetical protein